MSAQELYTELMSYLCKRADELTNDVKNHANSKDISISLALGFEICEVIDFLETFDKQIFPDLGEG